MFDLMKCKAEERRAKSESVDFALFALRFSLDILHITEHYFSYLKPYKSSAKIETGVEGRMFQESTQLFPQLLQ